MNIYIIFFLLYPHVTCIHTSHLLAPPAVPVCLSLLPLPLSPSKTRYQQKQPATTAVSKNKIERARCSLSSAPVTDGRSTALYNIKRDHPPDTPGNVHEMRVHCSSFSSTEVGKGDKNKARNERQIFVTPQNTVIQNIHTTQPSVTPPYSNKANKTTHTGGNQFNPPPPPPAHPKRKDWGSRRGVGGREGYDGVCG